MNFVSNIYVKCSWTLIFFHLTLFFVFRFFVLVLQVREICQSWRPCWRMDSDQS